MANIDTSALTVAGDITMFRLQWRGPDGRSRWQDCQVAGWKAASRGAVERTMESEQDATPASRFRIVEQRFVTLVSVPTEVSRSATTWSGR
jgi:hypothetical protein